MIVHGLPNRPSNTRTVGNKKNEPNLDHKMFTFYSDSHEEINCTARHIVQHSLNV